MELREEINNTIRDLCKLIQKECQNSTDRDLPQLVQTTAQLIESNKNYV